MSTSPRAALLGRAAHELLDSKVVDPSGTPPRLRCNRPSRQTFRGGILPPALRAVNHMWRGSSWQATDHRRTMLPSSDGVVMMRWPAFRVGAIAWAFTGVAHSILEFVLPRDLDMTAVMRSSDSQVGPVTLNAELLNRGVSLSMGLAMILVGVLLWMVADLLRGEADVTRRFGVVSLAGSAVLAAVAALFVPGPPLVMFIVATIAFALALIPRRQHQHPQTRAGASS